MKRHLDRWVEVQSELAARLSGRVQKGGGGCVQGPWLDRIRRSGGPADRCAFGWAATVLKVRSTSGGLFDWLTEVLLQGWVATSILYAIKNLDRWIE